MARCWMSTSEKQAFANGCRVGARKQKQSTQKKTTRYYTSRSRSYY